MRTKHSYIAVVAVIVGVLAGVGAAPGVLATDDPSGVGAVAGDTPTEVSVPASDRAGPPERADESNDNEATQTLSGTLRAGDSEDYRLDGRQIDIGPAWHLNDTDAPADFDGDSTNETIRAEFDSLVGQSVTMTVEVDDQDADIRAVDGRQYRQPGPPPWAGPPDHAGPPDDTGSGR